MNILGRFARLARPRLGKLTLVSLLSPALLFAAWPQNLSARQDAQAPVQAQQATEQNAQSPAYTPQSPEQIQELVAPIALYPDSLVAQILAASTFPEQVVEADRWVQANPNLQGDALAHAVDQQPWDPSVKALCAFPSVLGNMDKNLSWTSSLGDAYYNQQQDVMSAVQVMRQKAEQDGNLKSTDQQTVTTQGDTVVINPANPEVVYVPEYDPWDVYGYQMDAWPGWYPYPGIWFGGPYLSWGPGFGIGFFGGFGWGWSNWGFNWGGGYGMYGGARYYSRSSTFYNRSNFYGGGAARGGVNSRTAASNRAGATDRAGAADRAGATDRSSASTARAFNGDSRAARGYAAPRGQSGVRSSAYSGYTGGAQAKAYSARGSASVGGSGSRGGGGGESRGGGGGGSRGGGGGGGRH